MLMLVESGAVDLVVVDSVAALVPQAELDGEMGDNQVGLQARMMFKAMRKLAGAMNQMIVQLFLSTSFVKKSALFMEIQKQHLEVVL